MTKKQSQKNSNLGKYLIGIFSPPWIWVFAPWIIFSSFLFTLSFIKNSFDINSTAVLFLSDFLTPLYIWLTTSVFFLVNYFVWLYFKDKLYKLSQLFFGVSVLILLINFNFFFNIIGYFLSI